MENNRNILGWYDKSWYIEKLGWNFMAKLENKLLDKWPCRCRKKAVNEYGCNKVDEIEKSFCDAEIKKEQDRLKNYYGEAMHLKENTIHILYDNDPKVDDVFIENLIKKRKEYEKFVEQIETDKLIYDSSIKSDE